MGQINKDPAVAKMYNVTRRIIKMKFKKFWTTFFNENKISQQNCKDMRIHRAKSMTGKMNSITTGRAEKSEVY